jgi:hypothetical protein
VDTSGGVGHGANDHGWPLEVRPGPPAKIAACLTAALRSRAGSGARTSTSASPAFADHCQVATTLPSTTTVATDAVGMEHRTRSLRRRGGASVLVAEDELVEAREHEYAASLPSTRCKLVLGGGPEQQLGPILPDHRQPIAGEVQCRPGLCRSQVRPPAQVCGGGRTVALEVAAGQSAEELPVVGNRRWLDPLIERDDELSALTCRTVMVWWKSMDPGGRNPVTVPHHSLPGWSGFPS